MKLNQKAKSELVKLGVGLGLGLFAYFLTKKKNIKEAAKETVKAPVEIVEAVFTETKSEKPKKKKSTSKKKVTKKLDINKDGKIDAQELDKAGIPPTDQNIIDKNNLKGKKAEAVKSGKPIKKKSNVSKEEFLKRMAEGRKRAAEKKKSKE